MLATCATVAVPGPVSRGGRAIIHGHSWPFMVPPIVHVQQVEAGVETNVA